MSKRYIDAELLTQRLSEINIEFSFIGAAAARPKNMRVMNVIGLNQYRKMRGSEWTKQSRY